MSLSPNVQQQNIHIIGGTIIDPANDVHKKVDLYIRQGTIIGVDTAIANNSAPNDFKADHVIHAEGKLILPGLVDLCARMREPGCEHKGSILSESRAAAAGGITHLCCPPDTSPIIDSAAVASLIQERAQQAGYAHILPIGAMTQGLHGSQLSEMKALQEAGCVGVTQLRKAIKDHRVLQRCLEYAATFDITVFFQSQDTALRADGCVHEGFTSTRLGLPGIPTTAETVALSRDLLLIEQTGVRAHFGQISCARSVEMIADAQQRGLPVTADVAIHQLLLSDEAIDGFNGYYHVDPPLRSKADREALRQGFKSGVIAAICSDHQPHEAAAKSAPFSATEAGISSIETLLPLSYQLVSEGLIDAQQWVKALSYTPASLLSLETGQLGEGATANLTIFNPDIEWEVTDSSLLSEGKNTPWQGKILQGKSELTLCEGRATFNAVTNFT